MDSLKLQNKHLFLVGVFTFIFSLTTNIAPVYLLECIYSGSRSLEPNRVQWFTKNQLIAFISQFGAGVLIQTLFLTMLPELNRHFERHLQVEAANSATSWHPITNLLVIAGFFTFFFCSRFFESMIGVNHCADLVSNGKFWIILMFLK